MNEQRERLIRRLREDRQSGATELALDTLGGLREFLVQQPAVAADEMVELATTLRTARPSMVPLNNALLRWQRALFPDAAARPDTMVQLAELDNLILSLRDAAEQVAIHAADLIRPGSVILTHSNSSAVRELFRQLWAREHSFSVIATMSGPGNEGARLADTLNRLAVPVTLITDAQMGLFMARADLAVCGCDTWLSDNHFVNKSGTYLLALAAQDQGKPMLVLADSFRDSDQTSRSIELEEMPAKELNSPTGTFITARNVYFETVPARLVSSRITETGPQRAGPMVPPSGAID